MKTIIHVNRHVIASNRRTGERRPALTCKTYKDNVRAHEVQVSGPCRVVYRPDAPLACGAVAWVETESEVLVLK